LRCPRAWAAHARFLMALLSVIRFPPQVVRGGWGNRIYSYFLFTEKMHFTTYLGHV
jgi:hypothetical protein